MRPCEGTRWYTLGSSVRSVSARRWDSMEDKLSPPKARLLEAEPRHTAPIEKRVATPPSSGPPVICPKAFRWPLIESTVAPTRRP